MSVLDNFEKLKVVGKGSSGTATLYRRKDNQLVVIKEVNTLDMDENELKFALNEVQVLSLLKHPNIISYYGSFIHEGFLMIEMEYADDGTLAQLLKKCSQPLSEPRILEITQQISAGLQHMHERNIIHRDLKSANIFLNRDGTVKVGDFGLSKLMITKFHADTVLGTPYYLSPELCKGLEYDQKTDIWALGCIVYEMATLKKPFMAPSLPALVKQIIEQDFDKFPESYNPDWHNIIKDLLAKDPQSRPSALEIQKLHIPKLQNNNIGKNINSTPKERSVIYEFDVFGSDFRLNPVKIPAKKVLSFSTNNKYCFLVTSDCLCYKWKIGNNEVKQIFTSGSNLIYSIKQIVAGNSFKIFLTNTGKVFSNGYNEMGALGHGKSFVSCSEPKIIDFLKEEVIKEVACGDNHVLALTYNNRLFTWGKALNFKNDNIFLPVLLPFSVQVEKIFCGPNSSAFITNTGVLYVCGSNVYNKLGIYHNSLFNFWKASDVISTFTEMKSLSSFFVEYISMGKNHSAVLTEEGFLFTMGNNEFGQLGYQHQRISIKPEIVAFLKNKIVMNVKCGKTFTVAITDDNVVYFWGTRFSNSISTQTSVSTSLNTTQKFIPSFKSDDILIDINNFSRNDSNFGRASKLVSQKITGTRFSETILEPLAILALYSSKTQIEKNEILAFQDMLIAGDSLVFNVFTTVPQPSQDNTSSVITRTY